jgi:hypothetical protein
MTQDEFRAQVEGFFVWAAKRDRKPSLWWLALEEYAEQEFNRAYEKEKAM